MSLSCSPPLLLSIPTPSAHTQAYTFIQPTIHALWRSFTQCVFVEDVGQVVFYKNCEGVGVREAVEDADAAGAEVGGVKEIRVGEGPEASS